MHKSNNTPVNCVYTHFWIWIIHWWQHEKSDFFIVNCQTSCKSFKNQKADKKNYPPLCILGCNFLVPKYLWRLLLFQKPSNVNKLVNTVVLKPCLKTSEMGYFNSLRWNNALNACIYLNALLTAFILEANNMYPDLNAPLFVFHQRGGGLCF